MVQGRVAGGLALHLSSVGEESHARNELGLMLNKEILRELKTKKAFPTGDAAAKLTCLAVKTYESGDCAVHAASRGNSVGYNA